MMPRDRCHVMVVIWWLISLSFPHRTLLHYITCIVLQLFVWLIMLLIIFFRIVLPRLNLVGDIIYFAFITLYYFRLYHILGDLEVKMLWDVQYHYDLICEAIVSHLLIACYTHKYTLSLSCPKLLVDHDDWS